MSRSVFKAYSDLLYAVRQFFEVRGVREVLTPSLRAQYPSNPDLLSLEVKTAGGARYLHTSPEFAMKQLLAEFGEDIYQICRVFRGDEDGALHRCEFTMIEWYRVGFSLVQLMDEVEQLLCQELNVKNFDRWTYQGIFQEVVGCDPLTDDLSVLQDVVRRFDIPVQSFDVFDERDLLDLLFCHCIVPYLEKDCSLCMITDYPAAQAELAELSENGRTAQRFEVFVQGIELANGYFELRDVDEYKARVAEDNLRRVRLGKDEVVPAADLLQAMVRGFPACSGVSLGFERLLMLKLKRSNLAEVALF